jgi:acyl carrier protein
LTREQILEQLTRIFRSVFDDDSIRLTAASNAGDIEEWDSLNQIKIILACEHSFKIKLNARKVNTLENVGQMLDYLQAELASAGKA